VSKLHVFDMDGTILAGSACMELCRQLGRLDEVLEVEEAWGRGEVDHVEFYRLLIEMWEPLTDLHVETAFEATQWLDGLHEVMSDITERGEYSAVVTMSPQFFADLVASRWGVTTVHGAAVRAREPVLAEGVLLPEDKPRIVDDLLARYGLTVDDCVAYGDSSSDIPLFQRLRHTVAVNANEKLRGLAEAVYDGSDLREVYAIGRGLLEGASAGGGATPARC
jgi:phosphoserine phosphatase